MVPYDLTEDSDNDALATELSRQLDLRGARIGLKNDRVPVSLSLRDGSGTLVGGVSGYTLWGWLKVNFLWVRDEDQHRGLGSSLMQRAEKLAQERGCRGVFLDTFSFQAPDFYRKLGYANFGDFAATPEHRRFFMLKELPAQGSPPAAGTA